MDKNKNVAPNRTIFIRKLPAGTTEAVLSEIFSHVGSIKHCFIVKKKESENILGIGYVTFYKKEDAEKAVNKATFIANQKLVVSFADPSHKHKKNANGTSVEANKNGIDENKESQEKVGRRKISNIVVLSGISAEATVKDVQKILKALQLSHLVNKIEFCEMSNQRKCHVHTTSKKDAMTLFRKVKGTQLHGNVIHALLLSQEKAMQSPKFLKQSRLIVRNLAFKCTKSDLQQAFESFGDITEIVLPTKPDGKLCGFGFIQFSRTSEASQAIEAMNSKKIAGRPIAVDWAVPKWKFQQEFPVNTSVASNKDGSKGGEMIKDKKISGPDGASQKKLSRNNNDDVDKSDDDDDDDDGKYDNESESDDNSQVNNEDDASDAEESDENTNSNNDNDSESETSKQMDSDAGHSDSDEDSDSDRQKTIKKKEKIRCVAVEEGSTIFIRNLSFDTVEDQLEEELMQFGNINYCKIVIDRNTERSKGMAFVQFENKESADKCIELSNNEGLIIDGRRLNITVAVTKDKAHEMTLQKKTPLHKEKQSSRNLHLAREGLIRAGTQAAIGMSKEDIDKRTKLEMQKREKLKDPNIFISETRLSIHNLPTNVDDKQLRQICLKNCEESGAKIVECRIMRDLHKVNSQGIGKSRGYAFVNFTQHKHALNVLRKLNNSADVFGANRRPIVEFSLENAKVLQSKLKRQERAKAKQETTNQQNNTGNAVLGISNKKKQKIVDTNRKVASHGQNDSSQSTGSVKQKIKMKAMPTHFGPKIRHRSRGQPPAVKKQPKKDLKQEKLKREREFADVHGKTNPKRRRIEQRDDFDSLVRTYRQKLTSAMKENARGSAKWFDV